MMHCLFGSVANMCLLLFLLFLDGITDHCLAAPKHGDTDLRTLLQNVANQELVHHLGTRYEVVHPLQVGQDWGSRLTTRTTNADGTVSHLQQTSLLIETYEHKLQLDLELNTNLFPSTLVQLVYDKGSPPQALHELPENCYYHAKVKNYPKASAAFYTCHGFRGIIILENRVFLLHPLHGNHSDNSPHLLYHFSSDGILNCANSGAEASPLVNHVSLEEDVIERRKYIEMALVVDQALFEKFKLPPKEVVAATIEIANYVDLLYRSLNTYISIVYLELWMEDQVTMQSDISEDLKEFQTYSERRIKRISIDSAHLLSGRKFKADATGKANLDTICTVNAVGLTSVDDVFQPHMTAITLAHLIGHNLGMTHDHMYCSCSEHSNCIMGNKASYFSSTLFSNCSINDYFKTLNQGYGACLFNMPTMRKSICGNSILEETEECDCGPPEECNERDPCCDPLTCRLITHAQCSSGPCCKKCKLLSSDHMCRPSKGECDIPEFCNGTGGQCPDDLYKRNGAICSGGLGYCFHGLCPLLKTQCQDIWGEDADSANSACFEKLNVLGTPNGNCGLDNRGEIHKCTIQDSSCGSLQCSEGERIPVARDALPVDFVIYRMNSNGVVHECKARTFSEADFQHSLVQDGTKCGYQKLCLNQTCTSIKNLVSGKCPLEDMQATCSGHGVCTNINTCSCEEGWRGADCSAADEEGTGDDYYKSLEDSMLEKTLYGENEMQLNPNLAITVLAASIILGLGLLVIVILSIFYRNLRSAKTSE